MIYSILQHKEIPVSVAKESLYIDDVSDNIMTRYVVYDSSKKNYIGYVNLEDTKNGVKVSYIRNENPDLYKHFGQVADQIEVEHCLKRGIDKPYIKSVAALDSHIKHYKRGKRFINEGMNIYFDYLLKHPIFDKYVVTGHMGLQKMYMPMDLINKIKDKIKLNPLLKSLK